MSLEVKHKSLSPWAPEFRHICFRGPIVRERFTLAHDPSLGDERGLVPLSEDEESFLRFLFKEAGVGLYKYRPRTLKRGINACPRALRPGKFTHRRGTGEQKSAPPAPARQTQGIRGTSLSLAGQVP